MTTDFVLRALIGKVRLEGQISLNALRQFHQDLGAEYHFDECLSHLLDKGEIEEISNGVYRIRASAPPNAELEKKIEELSSQVKILASAIIAMGKSLEGDEPKKIRPVFVHIGKIVEKHFNG